MRFSLTYLVLLILTSLLNTVGQLLMRWGGARAVVTSSPAHFPGRWLAASQWWLLGIGVSWCAGIGWAWCLRRLPLGFALPLYTGLVYVLSLIGARYVLEERMSSVQIAGLAAILCGLLLLTLPTKLTLNIRPHG
jgi:multidrug transporter EmrE-like cation transporter